MTSSMPIMIRVLGILPLLQPVHAFVQHEIEEQRDKERNEDHAQFPEDKHDENGGDEGKKDLQENGAAAGIIRHSWAFHL